MERKTLFGVIRVDEILRYAHRRLRRAEAGYVYVIPLKKNRNRRVRDANDIRKYIDQIEDEGHITETTFELDS